MRKMLLVSVLAFVAPALAQDNIVIDPFEHKSPNGPDSVLGEALPEAAEALLKKAFPNPEHPRGFKMAVEAARKAPKEYVKYEILDGPRARIGAPGYVVLRVEAERAKLKALVDQHATKAQSAPVQKILLVFTEEKRIITGGAASAAWEYNKPSKVMVAIEAALLANDFRVVNGEQLEIIRERKINAMELSGEDQRHIQEFAADQGAEIIVFGHVKAEGPLTRRIARTGRVYNFWKVASATARAVWTDTGEGIFSIPYPDGAREAAEEIGGTTGAEIAFEKAGQTLAAEFVKLAATKMERRAELEVEIRGLDLRKTRTVMDWMRSIPGVKGVSRRGTGIGRFSVKTSLSPIDFGFALLEKADEAGGEFTLKDEQIGGSTLELKVVPN